MSNKIVQIIDPDAQISRDQIKKALQKTFKFIGDDPNREGLLETPDRIINSWKELFAGYNQDYKKILSKFFVDGACDEMVICRDITGYSFCEHHMIPFSYRAHIGYIPDGKVIGLSKLARVTECFGRRLQIQEKMTTQIAEAINEVLQPKGVMVVIEGQHLCMLARGAKQHESKMVTSAIRGVFTQDNTRNEFLKLIK